MEKNLTTTQELSDKKFAVNQFYDDVIKGLRSSSKYLESKYFYDTRGDKLFQDIMNCAEYYPTDCEMEIFADQSADLGNILIADGDSFDLIELGAGDATKSIHLLRYLMEMKTDFRYIPIDISPNIISYLDLSLTATLPGLKIEGMNGEYFEMLKMASEMSNKSKVVLFLGSNIGNMRLCEAEKFCLELRRHLNPGDVVLIGADLKKNPKTILAAYNDAGGITKEFNLNLLARINRELNGNFDLSHFDHFPTYDPKTGACVSYLISLSDQEIKVGNESISFKRDEFIYMEISQKFTINDLQQLAANSGFRHEKNFFDKKNWFVDVIWIAD